LGEFDARAGTGDSLHFTSRQSTNPPQILNVAARHGDGQLAMDMFYAMESWGYAPSASAFNAVLQALALSRNDVAMLKALNVSACFLPPCMQ